MSSTASERRQRYPPKRKIRKKKLLHIHLLAGDLPNVTMRPNDHRRTGVAAQVILVCLVVVKDGDDVVRHIPEQYSERST
jgi:hypothetical protein